MRDVLGCVKRVQLGDGKGGANGWGFMHAQGACAGIEARRRAAVKVKQCMYSSTGPPFTKLFMLFPLAEGDITT